MPPRKRLWNLAVALDSAIATLFGAWPDETLSSYAWRLEQAGDPDGIYWRKQIDDLWFSVFRVEHHCKTSYENHMKRNAVPPESREIT